MPRTNDGSAILVSDLNTWVIGTTQPTTQVTGATWVDTSAAGGPIPKVKYSGSYYPWALHGTLVGGSGMRMIAFNNAEASTSDASTNDQTLRSFTGINIPTTSDVIIRLASRTGGANSGKLGLRLNSTIVNGTALTDNIMYTRQNGGAHLIRIGRRDVATVVGWYEDHSAYNFGSYTSVGVFGRLGESAAIPAAAITTIDILGKAGASSTLYLSTVEIWEVY